MHASCKAAFTCPKTKTSFIANVLGEAQAKLLSVMNSLSGNYAYLRMSSYAYTAELQCYSL